MRIISHLEGTVTVEASWDEVCPVTGAPVPLVLEALQSRYKFNASGISAVSQQSGLFTPLMQMGLMQDGDVSFPVNMIEFQPFTFSVVCSTTVYSGKVIEDMFSFLVENFGFRKPNKDRQRYYRSSIIFDLGVNFNSTMGKWYEVLKFFNEKSAIDMHNSLGVRFAKAGFGVAPEPIAIATPFVIERRVGSPLGENWWFSQAPVDTTTHLAILEKIEQVFG